MEFIKIGNKEKTTTVSHLLCREIQTPMVSALIEQFAEEFGLEKTKAFAREVIHKDAVLSGKTLSGNYSGNSLKELLKIVEEVWAIDGNMEVKNLSA